MSRVKKPIRNKIVSVVGLITSPKIMIPGTLEVIITNDEKGKTISIRNGTTQFTIPFEPIERYLK